MLYIRLGMGGGGGGARLPRHSAFLVRASPKSKVPNTIGTLVRTRELVEQMRVVRLLPEHFRVRGRRLL